MEIRHALKDSSTSVTLETTAIPGETCAFTPTILPIRRSIPSCLFIRTNRLFRRRMSPTGSPTANGSAYPGKQQFNGRKFV